MAYIRTGMRVYDIADPRHVGRIEAVVWDAILVKWIDTGWLSYVPRENLREADTDYPIYKGR